MVKDGDLKVESAGQPTIAHPINATVSLVRLSSAKTAICFRLELHDGELEEDDDYMAEFDPDREYELDIFMRANAHVLLASEAALSVGQRFSPESAFVSFSGTDGEIHDNEIAVTALDNNRVRLRWSGVIRELFRSERIASMEADCWATLKTTNPKYGIAWQHIFDDGLVKEPRANEYQLRILTDNQLRPIVASEIDEAHWKYFPVGLDKSSAIPSGPLPDSYISFLQWSNGGYFEVGARIWQMFAIEELRRELLGVAPYLPNALPIAMNGGGSFYLLDMREPPMNGEYPVVACQAGCLGRRNSVFVADSFAEACLGWRSL